MPMLALVLALSVPSPPRVFWSQSLAGIDFRWTASDFTAVSGGRTVSLFRAPALALLGSAKGGDPGFMVQASPLSVVGNVVSYDWAQSECGDGMPHCDIEISYRTVRIVPGGDPKPVALTDFFPESEILKALLADDLVAEALEKAGGPKPRTLAELEKHAGSDALEGDDGTYALDHPATNFYFHHLEKGRVAVRINIPLAAGTAPSMNQELGLLLPIPKSLAAALEAANKGQGFLGAKRPAKHSETAISGTSGAKKSP